MKPEVETEENKDAKLNKEPLGKSIFRVLKGISAAIVKISRDAAKIAIQTARITGSFFKTGFKRFRRICDIIGRFFVNTNRILSPRFLTLPKGMLFFIIMFLFSFLVIALETIQFHVLMIVTTYLKATFVISIAMLGIAIGGLIGFYIGKGNYYLTILVSGVLLFLSIILAYYNIINIGFLKYPYFLILPFIFASIIISILFTHAGSNTIYFTNLIASALGVLFPIFVVPIFKSESSMILLMFIPIIAFFFMSLRIPNLILKAAAIVGVVLFALQFTAYFEKNTQHPVSFSKEVFEEKIIGNLGDIGKSRYTTNYEKDLFNTVYEKDEEGQNYVFISDEYDLQRVTNLLNIMGFLNRFKIPFLQYFESKTLIKSAESIPADIYEKEIYPFIVKEYPKYFYQNYDRLFLERAYVLNEETEMYILSEDNYDRQRAKYLLGSLGHISYIDLNLDVRNHYTLREKAKIYPENNSNRVLISEDSMLGRVEYIGHDNYIAMGINGVLLDVINRTNGSFPDPRVPPMDDADIFIVGLSADGIVKSAKRLPGSTVSGIEINPTILRTMQEDDRFSEYAVYPYEDVEVYSGEGRSFLENTDKNYDMITLMNIHMEHGLISTLSPEYFHTIEGTELLLSKLTDRGYVVYEEIVSNQRSRLFFHKFLNTIKEAMRGMGIENPENHIHIFVWDFWSEAQAFKTLTIKRTPFTEEEIRKFDKFVADCNRTGEYYTVETKYAPFRTYNSKYEDIIRGDEDFLEDTILPTYLPAKEFTENISSKITDKSDLEFILTKYTYTKYNHYWLNERNLTAAERERYISIIEDIGYPYKMDLSPATDNQPFPFDVYENKTEIKEIFFLILKLSMILIIPVFLILLNNVGRHKIPLVFPVVFTAVSGFGFMLVEIVLMQKFQQFIGDPMFTLIVILGGLLLFSGIGSFVSRFLPRFVVIILIMLIPVLLILKIFYLDDLFLYFGRYGFNQKLWISAGMIFPLAFFMGMPFPNALSIIKKKTSNEFGALMFGISGGFSTIAVVSAFWINIAYGFNLSFLIGTICYSVSLLFYLIISWIGRNKKQKRLSLR